MTNEPRTRSVRGFSVVMKQMWYFKLPSAVYANGPIEVSNEREARQYVREFLGKARVPNGTEFWRKGR